LGVVGIVTRVVVGQQIEQLWRTARRHREAEKVCLEKWHPWAQCSRVGDESPRVDVACKGAVGSADYIGMRVSYRNGWRVR
jgi:hypothetical protein